MSKKKTTKDAASKKRKSPPKIKKIPPEIKEQKLELFIQKSDEFAEAEAKKRRERQRKKIDFIGGGEIDIDEYVLEVMAAHITKFSKEWFYRLADLYEVDRKLMDIYVKPAFVRLFIIQFVYARFPYSLLRTLRSRNRKLGARRGKLHQHLKKEASDELIAVIKEVFDCMGESAGKGPLHFKMTYSKDHVLFFQTDLFD